MENLLKTEKHIEVVNKTLKYLDRDKYKVYKSPLWTVAIPIKEGIYPSLVAHTDIVGNTPPKNITKYKDVVTGNGEILGGDDRCGCYIIQQVIKKSDKDFIYILPNEEEIGCIGSNDLVKSKIFSKIIEKNSCFIGLDRRESSDLALYGYNNQELISLLETETGYKRVNGSITDVAILSENSDIACVNFSVGFYNEHTPKEYIDFNVTKKTLNVILNLPKVLWKKVFTYEKMQENNIMEICYGIIAEIMEMNICNKDILYDISELAYIGSDNNGTYIETIMEICEKYGVYCPLFEDEYVYF